MATATERLIFNFTSNNVSITPGSGDSVAAEDISSVKYQLVKLVDATSASTTRTGVAANPIQVSLANHAANATAVKTDGSAVAQPVTDNSSSLTVDNGGTFAVQAAQSGTWTVQPGNTANTTAWKVDASSVAVPVTDNSSSLTVDNGGTFAVQESGAALTALQLIDDPVATTASAIPSKGMAVSGTDGTNARILKTDTSGELQVDVLTLPNVTIGAALPAGTNGIGKLTSNSGVTIGAVELAAAQTLATVTTVTTVSTVTGGGVAHDGGDSGNPIKIGAKAETSPKGITAVADADRTDLYADADGMLMVKLNTSGADHVSERVSNTDGNSTAFSNFSAVASTYNYVTAISLWNSSATAGYVDFRDGTAGSVLWTMPIPAGGGSVLSCDSTLFKTSANTALAFDVSGALSTVYISVSGFQSKV